MTNSNLILALGNTQKKSTSSSSKKTKLTAMTNIATSYQSILQDRIATFSRPVNRNVKTPYQPVYHDVSPKNFLPTNSQIVRGDANDDGIVDEKDKYLILDRLIAEMQGKGYTVKLNMNNVDFSGDGKVTLQDYADFLNIYEQQKKAPQVLKGDANDDGVVDKKDFDLLQQHLLELGSVKNFNAADMNDDGKITITDVSKLSLMLWEKGEQTREILKGDANGDGKVNAKDTRLIDRYILEFVDDSQIDVHAADINDNGKITMSDKFMLDQMIDEQESKLQTLKGDSNGDGYVDESDYENIQDYLSGRESSEDFIRKNSDINGDGVVDKKDLQGVRNILDGRKIDWDESKRLLGDVSGDGKIDMEDAVTIVHHVNKVDGYADKKDFYWDNADVNHDGKIDLEDATRIQKFFNGNISTLDQEIYKVAPPFALATITQQSEVYSDFYFTNGFTQLEVGQQVRVTGMSSDGTALEIAFPTADGGEAIGWVDIQKLEKSIPPPPPTPVYPYPAQLGNRAIWAYADENLTTRLGNDVVLAKQTLTVLGESDNALHISYVNSKGEVLDRWIAKKYPSQYQEWTALATSYTPAFQYENLTGRIGNEAVFERDVITVIDERDDAYQVKYKTTNGSEKIRWISKSNIIPYEKSDITPVPAVLQEVIDTWVGKIWKNETTGKGNYECKDFAAYVFRKMYGIWYIGSTKSKSTGDNYMINISNPAKVGTRGEYKDLNQYNVQSLFSGAGAGDFVQMRRTHGGSHSAIVVNVTDKGVWFLEANAPDSDGGNHVYNKVKYQFHTWKNLAEKNSSMSVYYAK